MFQPEIAPRPYWITMPRKRKVNRENGYQRRVCLICMVASSGKMGIGGNHNIIINK